MTPGSELEQPKFSTKRKEGSDDVIFEVDGSDHKFKYGRLEISHWESVLIDGEPNEQRIHDVLSAYYQGKARARQSAEGEIKGEIRRWLDL